MRGWTSAARRQAYEELFVGEDRILSSDDVRVLEAVDSELERQGGDGVWGTDEYGIHSTGPSSGEHSLGVVCVFHPQSTSDSALQGQDELDDGTEERLNVALWQYSERVAALIETRIEKFCRETQLA